MTKTNKTAPTVKLFKSDLITMLADHRVDSFPALYGRKANGTAEHYTDAVFFVEHHLGPTKSDLILSARCFGLIPAGVEVR